MQAMENLERQGMISKELMEELREADKTGEIQEHLKAFDKKPTQETEFQSSKIAKLSKAKKKAKRKNARRARRLARA